MKNQSSVALLETNSNDDFTRMMTPTIQLLLACSQVIISDETAAKIQVLLRLDIDWNVVFAQAEKNRLITLVYQNLTALETTGMPEYVHEKFRDACEKINQKNLMLSQELVRLLGIFEAEQISVIPLKGPALAVELYGHRSLRSAGDLDILIKPQDVKRAIEIISANGYRAEWNLNHSTEALLLHIHRQIPYINIRQPLIYLELHTDLFPLFYNVPLCGPTLWENAKIADFDGQTMRRLDPMDLLLFLCIHGTKHNWSRLIWICDIAELLRVHTQLDWKHVVKQADTLGCKRSLCIGIHLAQVLLGTKPSGEIQNVIQGDPVLKTMTIQLIQWLFPSELLRSTYAANFFFQMQAMDRWRDRIHFILHREGGLLTIDELDRLSRIPTIYLPIYYPFHKVWMSITKLFKRTKNDK